MKVNCPDDKVLIQILSVEDDQGRDMSGTEYLGKHFFREETADAYVGVICILCLRNFQKMLVRCRLL